MEVWAGSKKKQGMGHPGTSSYLTLPWAVVAQREEIVLPKYMSDWSRGYPAGAVIKERPSCCRVHVHSSGRKALQPLPLLTFLSFLFPVANWQDSLGDIVGTEQGQQNKEWVEVETNRE